jgi:Protein of unknown function (DUF429)
MAVLSVDLAYRSWSDLGVVVLDRARVAHSPGVASTGAVLSPRFNIAAADQSQPMDGPIACEIIPFSSPAEEAGPVDANILAGQINHLCNIRNIRVIMLDGPQAWKSRSNGLEHSRVSERQLNTAAKTGLPGMVKPVTYRAFAEFCLDVYDALCRRGWRRLDTQTVPDTLAQPGAPQDRVLVESYPHAAWKSLGLKPLPSKRRSKVSDLAEAYGALRSIIPITTNRPPNHDQLQAIVGGLPGLALEERNSGGTRIVGNPPRREDGHWREGFIVLPVPPLQPASMAWLNSMRWLD